MTKQSIKPQPPIDEGWVKELEVDLKTYCFKWNEANQEWRFRNAETYESFKDVLHYIGIVIHKTRQEAIDEILDKVEKGLPEKIKTNKKDGDYYLNYGQNACRQQIVNLIQTLRKKYDILVKEKVL